MKYTSSFDTSYYTYIHTYTETHSPTKKCPQATRKFYNSNSPTQFWEGRRRPARVVLSETVAKVVELIKVEKNAKVLTRSMLSQVRYARATLIISNFFMRVRRTSTHVIRATCDLSSDSIALFELFMPEMHNLLSTVTLVWIGARVSCNFFAAFCNVNMVFIDSKWIDAVGAILYKDAIHVLLKLTEI